MNAYPGDGIDPADNAPRRGMGPTEFVELTGAFRTELLAHCYRMTGSLQDSEDLLQETMLRAWRAREGFEHRAGIRTWLYRIATNVCLNAITRGPQRRVLPAGIGAPSIHAGGPLEVAGPEVAWLEPIPDRMLAGQGDPAELLVARESVRLAFVAALQYLSPRHRAILLLRDVVEWPARDVAELLGTSIPAVNAALLRARRTIAFTRGDESALDDLDDPATRALLDRYVAAFERADMATLAALLHADAEVQMPPHLTWFRGPDDIVGFFGAQANAPGQMRMVRTRANGQPAFATYRRSSGGEYAPNSVHLISCISGQITTVVAFVRPSFLLPFLRTVQ